MLVATYIREIAKYLDAKVNLSMKPRPGIRQLVYELRDLADEVRGVMPGPRAYPRRRLAFNGRINYPLALPWPGHPPGCQCGC